MAQRNLGTLAIEIINIVLPILFMRNLCGNNIEEDQEIANFKTGTGNVLQKARGEIVMNSLLNSL